ncbi:GntR family transcriptional regulator, partial [Hansschlegelia zhihuaiae]|uniref:GntR family transcriptional regulator n=1 Tax=Hansschlegelia zhihuaiae TaxID=405005 RepID=UPI001FDF711A
MATGAVQEMTGRTAKVAMHDSTLRGNHAYDLIRREIVSCRIMPGARFTEPELMERYGLGKSSLRIALQRLTEGGLVSSIPRHGYRVAPITVKDVDE